MTYYNERNFVQKPEHKPDECLNRLLKAEYKLHEHLKLMHERLLTEQEQMALRDQIYDVMFRISDLEYSDTYYSRALLWRRLTGRM